MAYISANSVRSIGLRHCCNIVRRISANILLFVMSVAVSLVTAEVTLRMISDHQLSGSWRIYDQRGLRLNRSKGSYPHHLAGHSTTYTFRYPHLRSGLTNGGRFRILVLGDSFTFGWLLDWPESYVGQLEARIRRAFGPGVFEIANAAVGGWGLDSYLAYLEGYGDVVSPDIVLVFLNTSDVERAIENGLYRADQADLTALDVPVPFARRVIRALPIYGELVHRSYLLDGLRSAYLIMRHGTVNTNIALGPGADTLEGAATETDVRAATLARRIFERIIEWCRERDATLVVVTTAWHNPPYDGKNANDLFMASAPKFFNLHEVEFFDGSPLLIDRKLDRDSPLYIEGDGHPNEAGARLIAEINWPFLEAKLTEFCKRRQCLQE